MSTSSGGPVAITAPWSMAMSRSDTDRIKWHVVLDDDEARAGRVADAQQQRPERLGLALGDAARRLVEQDHRRAVREQAGEVDDAAGAGRQLADELARGRAEPEQLDRARRRAPSTCALGVERVGQVQGRARSGRATSTRTARTRRRSSRSTVSDGKRRASWNERPRPALGAARCGSDGVTSTPARCTCRARPQVKPEIRSNSVVLPAPFGPMMPTISPGATDSPTLLDRPDATERAR